MSKYALAILFLAAMPLPLGAEGTDRHLACTVTTMGFAATLVALEGQGPTAELTAERSVVDAATIKMNELMAARDQAAGSTTDMGAIMEAQNAASTAFMQQMQTDGMDAAVDTLRQDFALCAEEFDLLTN